MRWVIAIVVFLLGCAGALAQTVCTAGQTPEWTGTTWFCTSSIETQVAAEATARNAAIAAIPSQFVSGFTQASPGLTAPLLSGSPCGSAIVGKYAVVTDLFSGGTNTNEVMRCGLTGTAYYWRPQRTDFAANLTTTGGTLALACLVSPPTMFLSGTLASSLTITMGTTNCWPGARFEVANNLTLGLNTATVTGLIAGATKVLGVNVHSTFVFDGAAWQFYQ